MKIRRIPVSVYEYCVTYDWRVFLDERMRVSQMEKAKRFCREVRFSELQATLAHFLNNQFDHSTTWTMDREQSNGRVYRGTGKSFSSSHELEILFDGTNFYVAVFLHAQCKILDVAYQANQSYIGRDVPYSEIYDLRLIDQLDELYPLVVSRCEDELSFVRERKAHHAHRQERLNIQGRTQEAALQSLRASRRGNNSFRARSSHLPQYRGSGQQQLKHFKINP